ncbi:sugar transporter [Thozetella sp. PMI_491]|nr:sugar transporter [Thozetella sp. PMI_491]
MAFLSHITKHFNKTLARSFLLIFLSTLNYGFDNQGFNTAQAMQAFAKDFGQYNSTTKAYALEPYWLSLFDSLNYIGFAVGVVVGSLTSARWGRRMCIFTMSCWALVAGAITISSASRDQILAGRILFYIYIGMELSVMPIFMSELMPAEIRGLTVGSYQFSLVSGGLIVNGICRGTSTMTTSAAWRIPISLFLVVPVIIICLVWFIPESPRWLLTKERTEEARASLQKLRQGTLTDAQIETEFENLQISLHSMPEQGKFAELFNHANRKRTSVVIGMNIFQQVTGQAFVSTYSAVFISGLGTVNPFNMTVINLSCYLVTMGIGLYLNDHVGRRPLLLISAIIQCASIMTVGGLGLIANPSSEVKIAIVAMVTVFGCGFILAWAPLTYVVTTEIAPLRLRDVTQRTGAIVNVFFQFLVNFTIPYLLYAPYANLSSKVGFIFGSMSFCAIIFTYFCVPECKGKSLEEIDVLFHQGVPLRKFGLVQVEQLSLEDLKSGEEKTTSVVKTQHQEMA